MAGNLSENSASVLQTDMPTVILTNSPLTNYFPARRRHFVVYLCVWFCVCISAALLGIFSPEWDFVSRAHWLALSPGSKTHLGVLWTERERYCEWWSRLWSDSLVLSSASSHYTANTHNGSVALLVPWIKPDFYLVSWELANSCCTQRYGSADCFAMHLHLFGCQPILVQYKNRLGLGKVRFCGTPIGNHKKMLTPATILPACTHINKKYPPNYHFLLHASIP